MSDASRSRVTITLGRSGQVVKRDISAADASFSSSPHSAGNKRSIRDRIGHYEDSSSGRGNKRQRGDISMKTGLEDGRISKDDLRLKLMQKSASKRAGSNGDKKHMDLREKLSKTVHRPMTSFSSKQRMPEPRETSMLRELPSARNSDVMHMESIRSSYSPWTLDHIRKRSPDGFPGTSRRISPQRNMEDHHRRPLNRTYDSIRSIPYVSRDVLGSSRPPSTTPASFVARSTISTLPPVTAKPAASQLGQLPHANGVAQRPSYMGDEQQSQQTVDGLLHALGLGKYAILFKAEEVDMTALKQMGENDLKELGIPMGPRKKILLALLPRAKRQQ